MPRHTPTHDDMSFASGRGSHAMAERFADAVDAADLKARGIADQAAGMLAGLRGRGRSALADRHTWLGPGPARTLARGVVRGTREGLAAARSSPMKSVLVAAAAGAALVMLARWAGGRGR